MKQGIIKNMALTLAAVVTATGLAGAYPVMDRVQAAEPEMTIHFIDLKSNAIKGDATLIESQGSYLLIDTGDKDDSNIVVNYLKEKGITNLDVYVSHFHSDHFGELNDISDNFTIDNLYVGESWIIDRALSQGNSSEDKEYASVYASREKFFGDVGVKVKSAKGKYCRHFTEVTPGYKFTVGAVTVETLGLPDFNLTDFKNDALSDPGLTETRMEHFLNNMSLCTRITAHSGVTYMSCGDAETEEESWLVDNGYATSADIWKMNHHGTDTSNSAKFVKAIRAKHAVSNHYVIQKEIDRQNKIYKKLKLGMKETSASAKKSLYGLIRTRPILERAEKYGEVYRTEFNGGIDFTVTGGDITVNTVNGFKKQGGKWYLYYGGKVVKPNKKGFITGYNGTVFAADKKGALKKGMYKYKGKYYYCYGGHNDAVIGAGWIKYKGKKYYSLDYFPYLAMGWKKIKDENYLFDEKTAVFIRKQKA